MRGAREAFRQIKQKLGFKPDWEVNDRFAGIERVFLAPPLTQEFLAAIELISPHCKFTATEENRALWEADQNAACWGEYEALAPFLATLPRPARILEIGCGMGRSIVFFHKKLHLEGSEFHAYEGDGSTTKYTTLGPRFEDSFCGNISQLRSVLDHNGIRDVTVWNAKDVPLIALPGPYDFLYSFWAIGYHWGLEHFLDDLLPLMHDKSIAAFTVPRRFAPFPAMKRLSWQLLDWPREKALKMLVLSKTALPGQ